MYSRDELENIIKKYGDSVYRLAYLKMKNKDKAFPEAYKTRQ